MEINNRVSTAVTYESTGDAMLDVQMALVHSDHENRRDAQADRLSANAERRSEQELESQERKSAATARLVTGIVQGSAQIAEGVTSGARASIQMKGATAASGSEAAHRAEASATQAQAWGSGAQASGTLARSVGDYAASTYDDSASAHGRRAEREKERSESDREMVESSNSAAHRAMDRAGELIRDEGQARSHLIGNIRA